VDTSTALTNVFNGNNPRSVASVDGSSFYVSGQGSGSDQTAGVFYAAKGATAAIPITGDDTATVKNGPRNITQDTREVQIYDGQLFVSVDSKGGKDNARSFVGTLGAPGNLPTSLANGGAGPTMLPGFGNTGGTGKVVLNANTANGVSLSGQEINLSPEDYFFANATTLYVADSGNGKQDSAATHLGDGGLQKWSLVGGSWVLDYTLADGLDLVANTAASGTTGLFGLAGLVVGDEVELFATNFTIGDTDQTYLFGITDLLGATSRPSGESFTELAAAPADTTFKGVSFAPLSVPEPQTWALMISGVGLAGLALRRRRGQTAIA
ncbi:MAG TPA: PEPxxWA-CTERM sorting domain-containing protein, partial [Phenylobacterium sp.]|nr:PEPxxWA-CTERM sorting domain-containing protein [Phenylobacterium sp.]